MLRLAPPLLRLLAPFAIVAAGLAAAPAAGAQDRYAVVIGAESYPPVIGPALGARADAELVGAAFRAQGFEVDLVEDPDEAALKRSLFELVDHLDAAGDGAVGVFYFAGHGVQINGDTFLLPVDARIADDLVLSGSALSGELVTQRLGAVDGATTLIVIDGASPNGLTARFDLQPGLAPLDRPGGGLVIFSHYPDQLSLPRQQGASVFARAFADLVRDDDGSFDDAVQDLRQRVNEESGGSRYAWVSGRLRPSFTLSTHPDVDDEAEGGARGASVAPAPAPTPMPSRSSSPRAETAGPSHVVNAFFAADRAVMRRGGEVAFTTDAAPSLAYGVADVAISSPGEAGEDAPPSRAARPLGDFRGMRVQDESAFFDALRAAVQRSVTKQAFVFIHGSDASFADAARQTVELADGLGFDGAPILYSWPSQRAGSAPVYARDGEAAQRTADKLGGFVMEVAERTDARKIHLIAHGMGSRALLDALDGLAAQLAREGRPAPFDQIILAAPDVDRDALASVAEQIAPTAARITLYASSSDPALARARGFDDAARAGDSEGGVVVVDGIDTVDASGAGGELFAERDEEALGGGALLRDVAELMAGGADPGQRGLEARTLTPGGADYWALPPRAISSQEASAAP